MGSLAGLQGPSECLRRPNTLQLGQMHRMHGASCRAPAKTDALMVERENEGTHKLKESARQAKPNNDKSSPLQVSPSDVAHVVEVLTAEQLVSRRELLEQLSSGRLVEAEDPATVQSTWWTKCLHPQAEYPLINGAPPCLCQGWFILGLSPPTNRTTCGVCL